MSDTEEEPQRCCKLDVHRWSFDFTIDDAKRANLCFQDTLMICLKDEFTTDTKPVGGYCISVESIGPNLHEFMIHVQSSMTIDGHFGGSKVLSSITERFHCLEEKRTEFIYKEGGLHEKVFFMGFEDNFYHVETTQVCPYCNKIVKSKDIPYCEDNRLISEGANILLMRYLAIINYHGTLSLRSIAIDGTLAVCNYMCKAIECVKVNDQYLQVYTVERKMYGETGLIQNIKTYLTPKGRIVRHDWLDIPYILRINPLVDLTLENRFKASLTEHWSDDMELFSKYLDEKSCKMAQQAEYLNNHPEIKNLIADYTQALLTVKPLNVIDFTIQHFKAFAKEPQVWDTDSMERILDVNLISQCPKKIPNKCDVCGLCRNCKMYEEIEPGCQPEMCKQGTPVHTVCHTVSKLLDDVVSSAQQIPCESTSADIEEMKCYNRSNEEDAHNI